MIATQLFETPQIRLDAIDLEKDPQVETLWTYDLDYAQDLREAPARPLSASELKKSYEKLQKKSADTNNEFYYAIRQREPESLVGFLRITYITWSNGVAFFRLDFGSQDHFEQFGRSAMQLALQYLFDECNLHRVTTILPEYRAALIGLLQDFGFVLEVRRRQAIFRNARFWDSLTYGLLRSEWVNQAVGMAK